MNLGDNNDDEDEKYYNDDDEPDECCGKDSVQPRPELNASIAALTRDTPEREDNVDKCECVPRVNQTIINDNNDTAPCNDTCTNRSEGAEDAPDTAEDAEGDTEEDADDDPEDEDAPEE